MWSEWIIKNDLRNRLSNRSADATFFFDPLLEETVISMNGSLSWGPNSLQSLVALTTLRPP
jgi:hypothetical protein